MSIRTLIEINHDFLYNWENHPEDAAGLILAAVTGHRPLSSHDMDVYGIKVIIQRHHADKVTVELA